MQKIKLILALSALLGSAAAFAEPQSCSARTVEGTYVYKGDGWAGTGDSRKPISITGVRIFYPSTYSVTNPFHGWRQNRGHQQLCTACQGSLFDEWQKCNLSSG